MPYCKEGTAHVLRVAGREHRIDWARSGELATPDEGSLAHFLKEHSWGFGRARDGRPIAYEVSHPVWRVWPEAAPRLEVDLALLYGPEWGFLESSAPLSVVAAEGSAVVVYPAAPRA